MADMCYQRLVLKVEDVKLSTGTAGIADVSGMAAAACFYSRSVVAVVWCRSRAMYAPLCA
jgi:hypothetical protein